MVICSQLTFYDSMSKVARWRDLKHFKHVTTTEFADGQAFFNILQASVILFFSYKYLFRTPAVHPAMHRTTSASRLTSCSLYQGICTISYDDWNALHDGRTAPTTAKHDYNLQKVL